jgi:hypothetical protein
MGMAKPCNLPDDSVYVKMYVDRSNPFADPVVRFHTVTADALPAYLDVCIDVPDLSDYHLDDIAAFQDGPYWETDEFSPEWLLHRYQWHHDQGHVHIVAFESETLTVVVPVHCPETKTTGTQAISALHPDITYEATRSPLAFVQIRRVQTKHGLRLVSMCTNPGCASHRTLHTLLYAHCFLPERSQFPTLDLEMRFGHDHMCGCAVSVVNTLSTSPRDFALMLNELDPQGPNSASLESRKLLRCSVTCRRP